MQVKASLGVTAQAQPACYTQELGVKDLAQGTTDKWRFVEILAVRCRPFYIIVVFTIVIIAVYIPLALVLMVNAVGALGELYGIISELQTHPNSYFIVTGTFNNASIKTCLLRFHQKTDFAT